MEVNYIVTSVCIDFAFMGFRVDTPEYLHCDLHSTYIGALRHVVRVLSDYSDDTTVVRRHWHKTYGGCPEVGRYLRVIVFDYENEKVYVINVVGHLRK